MKYLYIIAIHLLFVSCSGRLNGLWIDSHQASLLKFNSGSVIYNSLSNSFFLDTMDFKRDKDSIWFTSINPWFDGRTEDRFSYELKEDTLRLRKMTDEMVIYVRSKAVNYKEHFLSQGKLKVRLPRADNVSHDFPTDRYFLDIRIGFKDKKIRIFVFDEEISHQDLDQRIKKFKNSIDDWDVFGIECRLFVDEDVTCGDTFFVVDQLMANEIRRIRFITEAERYNGYSSDFWGILVPGAGEIRPLYKLNEGQ